MPIPSQSNFPLTVKQRGQGRRNAYWNGALWSVGNGLASSSLVIYLAIDLRPKCPALGISLIIAAPQIVGLLRLATPAMLARLGNRKRFCLGAYFLSAVTLLGIVPAVSSRWSPSANVSLTLLVILWCVYHLLQYLATVALWSWLADLVPVRIRGRFIGIRQRWMLVAQAASMLSAGLFVWKWHDLFPGQPRWVAYAVPAVLGAGFMLGALAPLARLPRVGHDRPAPLAASLRATWEPFRDRRFLGLMLFGCWFSFANGITQSAQFLYAYKVLHITLFATLALKTAMRGGQLAISPRIGSLADRLGNRPVMIVSLAILALALPFHLLATPEQWWWIIGAWVTWIAYAGLNVCLPNLILKTAPTAAGNAPRIAAYYAITGLCMAASAVLGGTLLDRYGDRVLTVLDGRLTLTAYQVSFALGSAARALSVVALVLLVREPPARP